MFKRCVEIMGFLCAQTLNNPVYSMFDIKNRSEKIAKEHKNERAKWDKIHISKHLRIWNRYADNLWKMIWNIVVRRDPILFFFSSLPCKSIVWLLLSLVCSTFSFACASLDMLLLCFPIGSILIFFIVVVVAIIHPGKECSFVTDHDSSYQVKESLLCRLSRNLRETYNDMLEIRKKKLENKQKIIIKIRSNRLKWDKDTDKWF